MNWTILQGLKIKLDESKGRWVDEFLGVLWAYHMTSQTSTNETPFNLAFSTEVVISIEIGLPTMWIELFDKSSQSDKEPTWTCWRKLMTELSMDDGTLIESSLVLQLSSEAEDFPSKRPYVVVCRSIKTHQVRQAISQLERALLNDWSTSVRSFLDTRS